MRAPISIVVPTLNSEAALAGLLGDLGEGLAAGIIREVVITDGGSKDGTQALAEAAGAIWVDGPASRGGQLRRGCEAAAGDWILVLHSDTRLEAGWPDVVLAHLPGSAPAAFRLRFDAKGLMPSLVAGWANLRSRIFRLPYGDQGLLVARADYEAAGGFPDQPLMEDVALVRALGRIVLLPASVETGAERYIQGGWFRRGARNLWTLTKYFAGVSPETLAASYRKR